MAKKTVPPGVVATLRALAIASGLSVKTISELRGRPGFPVLDDGRFNVWQVCSFYHQQLINKREKNRVDIPPELEPGAGDSPWLERYREARTHRENLKLEQERRNLIPRDVVHTSLMQIAVLIRGSGETLQQQFGPGAVDVLETAFGEVTTLIDAAFGLPDDDDATDDEPDDFAEPAADAGK